MGIKPKFTKEDIRKDLNKFRQKVEDDLVQILHYVGMKFIKEARDMTKSEGGFDDDTGNLRSSIGYFILKDGQIIEENLKTIAGRKFKLTEEGKIQARSTLQNVPSTDGYQIVGVAGMDYASKVESKGYNVITKQSLTALVNLDKLLKRYVSRMNAMGISFDVTGDVVQTEMA
jgi:hypothetical protein